MRRRTESSPGQRAARRLGGAPGDVQAEPGRAGRRWPPRPRDRVAGVAKPGPASATVSSAPPPGRRSSRTVNAVPVGRVREHVAEQGVHARGEVGGGQPRPAAGRGQVERERPGLVLGQHRPERDPVRDHRRRVAGGPARRPRRRASSISRGHRPLQGVHRGGRSGRPRPGRRATRPPAAARSAGCAAGATGRRPSPVPRRAARWIRPARWFSAPATSRTSGGPAGSARAVQVAAASRCDTGPASAIGP